MSTQDAGLLAVAVGMTLLWSEWALVIAGLLMLLIPEIAAMVRRGDRAARK